MGQFSKNLRERVLNKGPVIGTCVICANEGKLTKDHVPPKNCNNLTDYELRTFLDFKNSSGKGATSQGGTHFRTLCSVCNSERLGLQYDPSLVDLSNEITSLVMGAKNKVISLPEFIYPFVKPQRLARSIVGHVLSAVAVEETKTGLISAPFPDALRSYFLDESSPLPDKLEIYYWVYPSRKQVVIKGAGKVSISGNGVVIGHIIKFLPLGFWLIWEKPKNYNPNLHKLIPSRNMGIDETYQMPISLGEIPSLDFPEAPEGHEVILLNTNNSSIGSPK